MNADAFTTNGQIHCVIKGQNCCLHLLFDSICAGYDIAAGAIEVNRHVNDVCQID